MGTRVDPTHGNRPGIRRFRGGLTPAVPPGILKNPIGGRRWIKRVWSESDPSLAPHDQESVLANPLTSSLARLFRDRAKPTSLRRLHKEGFRTVPVLDIAQLEELVRHAIEKVIRETTDDPEESLRLARTAQVEFLKMLGNPGAIDRTSEDLRREQDALELNLRKLRDSLQSARIDLEHQVEEGGRAAVDQFRSGLDESLEEIWQHALGVYSEQSTAVKPALDHVRGSIRDSVMALFQNIIARIQPTQSKAEAGGKVELLERRVHKLTASLDHARQLLKRLRDRKEGEIDGIASIYDEVQGLTGREDNYEQRRKLLSDVFQLNLDIRRDIASESAAATPTPKASAVLPG